MQHVPHLESVGLANEEEFLLESAVTMHGHYNRLVVHIPYGCTQRISCLHRLIDCPQDIRPRMFRKQVIFEIYAPLGPIVGSTIKSRCDYLDSIGSAQIDLCDHGSAVTTGLGRGAVMIGTLMTGAVATGEDCTTEDMRGLTIRLLARTRALGVG